jgi:hypothetical protein
MKTPKTASPDSSLKTLDAPLLAVELGPGVVELEPLPGAGVRVGVAPDDFVLPVVLAPVELVVVAAAQPKDDNCELKTECICSTFCVSYEFELSFSAPEVTNKGTVCAKM